VDSIEIHWPSGAVQKVASPGIDRIITVKEGEKGQS
jgi:enediyne biosynthesis protein E4